MLYSNSKSCSLYHKNAVSIFLKNGSKHPINRSSLKNQLYYPEKINFPFQIKIPSTLCKFHGNLITISQSKSMPNNIKLLPSSLSITTCNIMTRTTLKFFQTCQTSFFLIYIDDTILTTVDWYTR